MRAGDAILSAIGVASGAGALVAPHRVIAWKRQRHARRRLARWQHGRDRYFEEARQLGAYPPPADPRRVRLAGAGLLALGLALFILSYHR